nr:hypothetical protein [Tanacetum cinerariifolium]
MTRSSTNELFTPFKDPEREFRSSRKLLKTLSLDESRLPKFNLFSDLEEYSEERSSRKLLKTLSLDESRLPKFNLFSDLEEYSEEEVVETMEETIEKYMSKTRVDYISGISRPKTDDNNCFELKGQFLKELRDNIFSGSDHEDVNGHIEKVLEIVDLFHIPNILKTK